MFSLILEAFSRCTEVKEPLNAPESLLTFKLVTHIFKMTETMILFSH